MSAGALSGAASARRTRRGAQVGWGTVASLAGLAVAVFVILFPIYWMVATSLKTPREILREPALIPSRLTLANYRKVLFEGDFLQAVGNSLVVAGSTTVVALVIAALAAYSLTRFRTPFRGWVGRMILLAYLTPTALLFIPLSILMARMGLTDSLYGLALVYLAFAIPLATWMLQGYFRAVPRELEEQAMVDGMSRLGALVRVVLPLSGPGLAAVAIFTFTGAWNEMLLALVLVSSEDARTAPLALSYLITSDVLPWGPLMAGAVVSSVPLMVLYFVAQRFMTQGLAEGSVKG